MFKGHPINIEGFDIPYNSTLFLIVLAIHIAAGLTCVISGIFAMLAEKRKGLHPKSGRIYYWGIWVVFITAALIAISRWKEDYHFFLLGTISFISAFIGRRALKKHWKKWPIYHITGMGISYIFLLIAFYVDNGHFFPIWKNLNPIIYWLLPLVIGLPILIRTLVRHPLSRGYFK